MTTHNGSPSDMTPEDPLAEAILERYRWAVQDPARQAAVLAEIHRRRRGSEARLMREDFAGNAADAVAFVAGGPRRQAIAVDTDAATLAHGERRATRLLGRRAEQIEWHCGDVHEVAPPEVPAADLLSVLNFSIGYLLDRRALLRYLRHARNTLVPDGVFIANLYGGPSAIVPHIERHRVEPRRDPGQSRALPPFDYLWETRTWDAVRNRVECLIHFEWTDSDGNAREHRDAFHYDWRLWSPAELVEALGEAGFRQPEVWRHTESTGGDGPRVFLGPVRTLLNAPVWVAYMVAQA
jgi:SAM-dependent methyltransferase